MILYEFYINTDVRQAMSLTQLELDELESVVGRFKPDHYARPNQLKGLLQVRIDGSIRIIHHFKKTVLWESH